MKSSRYFSGTVRSRIFVGFLVVLGAVFANSIATGLRADDLIEASQLGVRGVVLEAALLTPDLGMEIRTIDGIGDFNGDGFDDIALTNLNVAPDILNEVVIVQGRPGIVGRHAIEDLAGTIVLRSESGRSVSFVKGVGDLNGDSYSDIVVSFPYNSLGLESTQGTAALIYGSAELPQPRVFEAVGDAIPGVIFTSEDPDHGWIGTDVESIGDFDGDGKRDLAIGASNATNLRGEEHAGIVFVLFNAEELPPIVDLSDIGQGLPGIQIHGATRECESNCGGALGRAIESVGDFDGDGFSDFLVLAKGYRAIYLIFGGSDLPARLDLADAGTRDGITIFQQPRDDGDKRFMFWADNFVGVGDVDGDGLDDIAIGLPMRGLLNPFNPTPNSEVYLIHGRPDFPKRVDIRDLEDGVLRIYGLSVGAEFKRGDVNVDGSVDISDPIMILGHLFLGAPARLSCQRAADSDDSGALDITDAINPLAHLFLGAPPLPDPFGNCDVDPTPDALSCDSYPPCEQ